MTQIGFIRHGITDWNIDRRTQGQSDIPLNETGRKQAHALAERLKVQQWDSIISSDLSRAKETAHIVAQSLGLSVKTDERLREKHFGEIEGTTMDERIKKWGNGWESLPLGVEGEESVASRGMSILSDLVRDLSGQKILVVSHGALIGTTLKRIVPHAHTDKYLHNTSITVLKHNTDWECSLYNCAKHLTSDSLHPLRGT